MSLIMNVIGPELSELFAIFDFVYTLASANIDQSAPNLVKMYVTISSQMSLIMNVIGPELSELFVL